MDKEKTGEIEKEVVSEEKKEEKKDVKKEVVRGKVVKKNMAFARGAGLNVSPKQCICICKVIRGKNPDVAVARLQDVIDGKGVIPMAGLEVGHRKGKGLAGGRFPKNACNAVINIVKQVAANAVVAGIENPVIAVAKADRASAPFRRGGRRAKRCNLYLEVRDKTKLAGKK
ncbi:MAG: hypothetical protein V1889_03460 [archaeon]